MSVFQEYPVVYLLSDFGYAGPYVGQMTASVVAEAPSARVVNLMHDLPAMRPDLSAYLLPAVTQALPVDSIVLVIVDPGVGGDRAGLVVDSGSRRYVGPDNGLLSRLSVDRCQAIQWQPALMSASFHGRDWFAPVAGRLATGLPVALRDMDPGRMIGANWRDECEQIVYIDGFGNALVGLKADRIGEQVRITVGDQVIRFARTFSDVRDGGLFWYCNSQGLVEIAANRASAAKLLSLELGDKIWLD